jgi:hypothetical protein
MLVVVSHVTTAVPVALDSRCAGLSLSGLKPDAEGPVATNSSAPLPVSMMLSLSSGFSLLAVSVAVSFADAGTRQ